MKAFDEATGKQPGSLIERLLEIYLFADKDTDGRSGMMAPAYITALMNLVEAKVLIKIEEEK